MIVLPNSYTQLHLISQDILSTLSIDTTDVSVDYKLDSLNNFSVIEITNQSDYQCYQQLIYPQAPYTFRYSGQPSIAQKIRDTPQCKYFVEKNNNTQNIRKEYEMKISDLFGGGKINSNSNLTNFSIIIDNTNLIWKIQNDQSMVIDENAQEHSNDINHEESLTYYFGEHYSRQMKSTLEEGEEEDVIPPILQNLQLNSSIKVVYNVSDKYFIMTVTFASLIVVVIAVLIIVIVLYKKKRQEYRNFLKHKEKKMKGDYKKYEYPHDDLNLVITNADRDKDWFNQPTQIPSPSQQEELVTSGNKNKQKNQNSDRIKVENASNGRNNSKDKGYGRAVSTSGQEQDQNSVFRGSEYTAHGAAGNASNMLNTSNLGMGNGMNSIANDDQGYQPKQYIRRVPAQNQYKLIGSNNQRTISEYGVGAGNTNNNGGGAYGYTNQLSVVQGGNNGGAYNLRDNRFTDDINQKTKNKNIYYIDSSDSD
eukprot:403331266